MRPAENIKRLLKNAKIKINPAVKHTSLQELISELEKSKFIPPAEPEQNIWRTIMKSKLTKLTAAAGIIIAVLIGISRFGGTVDLCTISFAQISEAMKKVSWMHQVSKGFERGISGKGEQWFGFKAEIFASKPAEGKPVFINVKEHKSYTYDSQNHTITLNHIEDFPLNLSSPVTMLESLNQKLIDSGAVITVEQAQYNGQKAQLQQISLSSAGQNNDETHLVKLYIEPESKLLIAAQVKGSNAKGDVIMDGEITFTYPSSGPSSIYDLGVPRDAKIIENPMKVE